ncbi:MAG: membrane protein insertase YidC, partial [Candidatus Omnitrophica bacterium]|nr:membrane protein insertase YidC [Candidatus Omnitrophota bacterium]
NIFNYQNDELEIEFIEPLAAIKAVKFKSYQNYSLPLKYALFLNDPSLTFKKESSTADSVTFVSLDSLKRISKSFTFHKSNYTIDLEIKIKNLSNTPLTINPALILAVLDFSGKNPQARYQGLIVATEEKTQHLGIQKNQQFINLKFLSFRDQYFCGLIEPEANNFSGFVRKLNNQESEIGLNLPDTVILPGQQIGHLFRLYVGPQDVKMLNNIKPSWATVIHYGTFDIISQVLLQVLGFLYRIVHNWGLAIILLSILVYFLLYPLSLKQMRSMKEMQALQPHIEELRKLYKDNPQRLNKETMELYRQHKVNPLGGCLPLILQMPIFFALYNALIRSVVLKGAKFLWIKDLSGPDKLFTLPNSLPFLGNEINILPIIMAIGMFIQQKTSTVATSGASAEQQKMMLILMPVMFGAIFYHMPAGLVLYWLVNSILMLVFQLRMKQAK